MKFCEYELSEKQQSAGLTWLWSSRLTVFRHSSRRIDIIWVIWSNMEDTVRQTAGNLRRKDWGNKHTEPSPFSSEFLFLISFKTFFKNSSTYMNHTSTVMLWWIVSSLCMSSVLHLLSWWWFILGGVDLEKDVLITVRLCPVWVIKEKERKE